MPRAPQRRIVRRPHFSTVQKEIGVEHTLTSVKIKDIKKELLMASSTLNSLPMSSERALSTRWDLLH